MLSGSASFVRTGSSPLWNFIIITGIKMLAQTSFSQCYVIISPTCIGLHIHLHLQQCQYSFHMTITLTLLNRLYFLKAKVMSSHSCSYSCLDVGVMVFINIMLTLTNKGRINRRMGI